MLRTLCHGLLFFSLMLSASSIEVGYPRCNCYIDSYFSAEGILQCQKVSDFLIAAAYFSIPLELLYFATCSDLFPFKWIVFQFGAFIVLCGLTHLLNVFTYEPHSFLLMLSLTISKFFTALVSFATAITLLTLFPQLLRLKVRENFLRIKARELDREVGMMKRKEEASWHVRMLTQEIRKSLDRHTILYTTLVELSKTLGLQNCAVWMPDEAKKVMNLTHELRQRHSMELVFEHSIPITNQDVVEVKESKGVTILRPDSLLALASSGGDPEPGPIAAIRMPMLKVSNFKGGTPELVKASYAILVLVLPRDNSRIWSFHEKDIIEVIADQVAVALSHAAVLEESQLMRDKMAEQNRALLHEKQNAFMASEARNSFQRVMSQGIRRPVHYILGLLSMMQQEELSPEQRLIINTITKTSGVVSNLVTDAMKISNINNERLTLERRLFYLHSLIKEAAIAARCLCTRRGFGFGFQVDNAVPDIVVGDEKRIFHVILHAIDRLLSGYSEGFVSFQVHPYNVPQDGEQQWISWKTNFPGVFVKFEIGIRIPESSDSSLSHERIWKLEAEGYDMGLGFNMCKKLVQMMHGDILVVPNSHGFPKTIELVLHFQLQQPPTSSSELQGLLAHNHTPSTPNFKGLRVLLADDDGLCRSVTRKLLEKLGCEVATVSSGIQCLSSFSASTAPYQLVIVELQMPQIDGFEVAKRIRKLRSRSRPAIVALTSSAEELLWQQCLHSGMNGLIRKPVMLQALGDELYRVLHKLRTE
ncbi:ethylene receptor 2 [Dendrobium catenatum]|uniref:Ethylene receptor n=1 Tax=Dendrobium catenatum TaxID=906689 RepID=A0A2I0WH09_9ASPA|nr:ethylene receptor 2 [Dendrobium catenatum]XP_020698849.1 ethylene receptor 2 [Dendrobium catenatum]PKU74954.1 Protein EIN4 [Dendrobium catenatum]